MLHFEHRLRAHSSSCPHGASMAGPLHRHVQAQAGGVLGLPGATEGPRLGERKHRKKKKKKEPNTTTLPIFRHLDLSTSLNFLGHFPRRRVSWGGEAVARGEGRVPAWGETAWKPAAGLNTNQLLLKARHNNIYTAAFSCDFANHQLESLSFFSPSCSRTAAINLIFR